MRITHAALFFFSIITNFIYIGNSCAMKTLFSYFDKSKQWFKAASIGDLKAIKKLINKINVNMKDEYGYTALILAADRGYQNIVEFLLKIPNINVNIQNNRGDTALYEATSSGHRNIVKLLLQMPSINVNAQNHDGWAAIHWATSENDIQMVKLLLDTPGLNINIQMNIGDTPLMRAFVNLDENIIKLLLSHDNIDVNIQNNEGYTALIFATWQINKEIVELLLNSPLINLNLKDVHGKTALTYAKERNFRKIEQLIKNKINALTLTGFESIKNQNIEILKTVIAQISDKVTDHDGNTFLHAACSHNTIPVALFLLTQAKDPRELCVAQNNMGLTPLDLVNPSSELFEIFMKLAYASLFESRQASKNGHTGPHLDTKSKQYYAKQPGFRSNPTTCACCQKRDCSRFCGKCKTTYYCSLECQKKDWGRHKLSCNI